MNTLLCSLILLYMLAVSSPHDKLPSLVSVEARKLNSNGRSMMFTVDLIHRDSLLSPKEHQGRLNYGSVSRGHRSNWSSSAYYENKDFQISTAPREGEYLMKIAIGTPPVEFMAIADTGSDLIWLQCSPCQPCIQEQTVLELFDPSRSSSYQSIACDNPICHNAEVTTACGANSNDANINGVCTYNADYGDGTQSDGSLSTDKITFSDSSVTLSSAVFGCGYAQQGTLSKGAGIIGLGAGPLSLVSQLGPKINYKFSYCLVPLSSGANSKLIFGADLTSLPGVVSTPFVTTSDIPDYYWLTLESISIGDSQVSLGQYKSMIIDSGTTLTYLTPSVYNTVKDAFSTAIGLSPSPIPGSPELCYDPQESVNPPDVVFHFSGADVLLNAINILRKHKGKNCLAIKPTDGVPTFGNIAQINFEVGYDLHAKQVSFAPADCTTY